MFRVASLPVPRSIPACNLEIKLSPDAREERTSERGNSTGKNVGMSLLRASFAPLSFIITIKVDGGSRGFGSNIFRAEKRAFYAMFIDYREMRCSSEAGPLLVYSS